MMAESDRVTRFDLVVTVTIGIVIVAVMIGLALQPQPTHELVEVVIQPGDTLWSLATTHYPGKDPREVVYIMREANGGLDPGAIRPGDVVLIPSEVR